MPSENKLTRQQAARKASGVSAQRSYQEKSLAAKKGWETRRAEGLNKRKNDFY
jgi:hypothetical protein